MAKKFDGWVTVFGKRINIYKNRMIEQEIIVGDATRIVKLLAEGKPVSMSSKAKQVTIWGIPVVEKWKEDK